MKAKLGSAILCVLAILSASTREAAAENKQACQLVKIGDLAVTVAPNNAVLANGSIKDEPVRFLVDTGAFATMFDSSVATHFGVSPSTREGRAYGAGGEFRFTTVRIPDLKIGNFNGADMYFDLASTHFLDEPIYAIFGEDFLGSFDLDLDLAAGKIGLFQYNPCPVEPVYWANNFSEADLSVQYMNVKSNTIELSNKIYVMVELNGTRTRAVLDTGAGRSVVTLSFARHLGINLDTPGVTKAYDAKGMDAHPVKNYQYRFSELKIGDEVVKNPTLLIADLLPRKFNGNSMDRVQDRNYEEEGMILGVDFIRQHHIYVSTKAQKMYFTWNGGSIFAAPAEDNGTSATAK